MSSDLTKRLDDVHSWLMRSRFVGQEHAAMEAAAHVAEAATEIERLEEANARLPKFAGVAKDKLDDLTSPDRGWNICGYAIEKNGEYGLVTTGSFVGWWTVASNNADAAQAEVARLRDALTAIRDSFAPDSVVGARPDLGFTGFPGFKEIARAALSNR